MFLLLNVEAANTNFTVFGLTQPELEPTIYHIGDEHANRYIWCDRLVLAYIVCIFKVGKFWWSLIGSRSVRISSKFSTFYEYIIYQFLPMIAIFRNWMLAWYNYWVLVS